MKPRWGGRQKRSRLSREINWCADCNIGSLGILVMTEPIIHSCTAWFHLPLTFFPGSQERHYNRVRPREQSLCQATRHLMTYLFYMLYHSSVRRLFKLYYLALHILHMHLFRFLVIKTCQPSFSFLQFIWFQLVQLVQIFISTTFSWILSK